MKQRIRALSVHAPFAQLIAAGLKKVETRSWSTTHRGSLVICSTLRRSAPDVAPLWPDKAQQDVIWLGNALAVWPPGHALCVVDVVGCRKMVPEDERNACCRVWPNAWSWHLDNLRSLEPFPVKGRQGLFYVETDAEVKA